ncbi:inositol hexakisphosphate kinase 1 [Ixodes scapularis]|uniref:inositol hexakisphosphate kinase 1 n=1 Tax=Ixodes scapularis TaxID=6945 RepID=UPI001A9F3696|nr:inositol hexakisphosphate kinase 1 [Ixodes scapularis]XP_029832761.2 inositol hexakisphosphate kinase 1 [Ixodes scapularis]XP_029832762.2 inositol hexakisphosphate kinase 1 [Ixodes scapularis]XP_029832763.2 inositol hexakisphosphate kinase 1 [Ixodes scapularis]
MRLLMAAESGGQHEYVVLEPFIHQVGGRSSMLCLDELTLCKPLILQELRFYENLPDVLKPFTSEYKGVVEVALSEDPDGYLTLTAHSSYEHLKNGCASSHSIKSTDSLTRARKYRMRWQKAGSIEIEPVLKESAQLFEEHDGGKKDSFTTHNPWIVRCHNHQIQKFLSSSGSPKEFILLENLTARYTFPCILDLKMGTRQYTDDASEEKRKSLDAKVASTTSSPLGLRICGMQVYQQNLGYYKCHNKYFGRSLNVEGFRQTLFHFLHDGIRFRSDILLPLIERLQALYKAVEQLESFRFYTSSLLILYEGKNTDGNSNESSRPPTERPFTKRPSTSSPVDVRMIDFAHSVHSPKDQGPDQGYLFGLKSLIAQLQMLKQDN